MLQNNRQDAIEARDGPTQKQVDLFHALYARTSYKQHFKHGQSKELSPVNPREIAAMLHRHVDKETFDTISQMLNN